MYIYIYVHIYIYKHMSEFEKADSIFRFRLSVVSKDFVISISLHCIHRIGMSFVHVQGGGDPQDA